MGALLGAALYVLNPQPLYEIDRRLVDERQRLRGPRRPPAEVVLVAIDEKSINRYGRWPWPRSRVASLIERIAKAGAKTIALDVVFSEPATPAEDGALAEAVARAGNVVLGYFFRDDASSPPPAEALEQLKRSAVRITLGELDRPPLGFPDVELNIPSLGRGASAMGFFNFPTADPDGLLRRSLLVASFRGAIYPSLALAAASSFVGGSPAMRAGPRRGVEGFVLGSLQVTTTPHGELVLNYYGPAGSLPTVSAADVLDGTFVGDTLAGRLVLVGATETGIADTRATPLEPFMPGVEVQATAAANILDGSFLVEGPASRIADYAALVVLPLALGLVLAFVPSTPVGATVWLAALALEATAGYWLFRAFNLSTTALYPALSLTAAFVLFESYRNVALERRRRYLRRAFSTYLAPELVRRLVEDPDRLRLGGRTAEVTVLFCDVRGFTRLAESLSAEETVELLNSMLGPLSRIVMNEGGMLDKYLGDGLMAVFGAPIEVEDHARRACRAALEMAAAVERLNEERAGRGLAPLRLGIGISTGRAVVGNIGADVRFDFTAVGDAVNVASRLEELSKHYGATIVVSESTREALGDGEFTARRLDTVRLRGRRRPVAVYEIVPTGDAARRAERFERARLLYTEKRFGEALALFRAIVEDDPSDGPALLYVRRCERLIENPPSPEWDAVFEAEAEESFPETT